MNIAIFTDTYFPKINGVAASIHTLAQALRSRGHKVYVFTVSEPKEVLAHFAEDASVFRFLSMPIIFLKPYRAAAPFSIRLIRLIKKYKIDIIHNQTEFFMGYMALGAATSLRIPIVHTYHTMWMDYVHYIARGVLTPPTVVRTYTKSFCNMAAAVIAPTEKTQNFLLECGVSKPIFVIPTGINLAPFRKSNYSEEKIRALKAKYRIDPSWPTLLCLGRVAKEKSIDQIVSQMPEIIKRVPDVRLVIVGSGPYLEELEQKARSLGVFDRIIFTGAVPYQEIGIHYQLGDAFVCCSRTETQGLTYYEAMAAELPIIARNDDCIKKVLRDKEDGRLFDSPEQLPDIVADVLTNKQLTGSYVKNAYKCVASFSAEIFGARVEDVYLHTIDRKRIRHEQRIESVVKNPMPRAIRKLRLITSNQINNARNYKKNAGADRR
jgi:1,2-diacylglycerol 3-alpha-glucosyltransferase